jgi:hypothetical protein
MDKSIENDYGAVFASNYLQENISEGSSGGRVSLAKQFQASL